MKPRLAWPFGPLTPMQRRWHDQQLRAMQERRAAPWPQGFPPHLRPGGH